MDGPVIKPLENSNNIWQSFKRESYIFNLVTYVLVLSYQMWYSTTTQTNEI